MSLKHLQNSTRLPGVTSQNVPLILRATCRVVTCGQIYQRGQQTFLLDVCSTPDIVEICPFTTWLAECLNIPVSSDRLYEVTVNLIGNSSCLWSNFSCESSLERRVALEMKATKSQAISRPHVSYVTIKSCRVLRQRPCHFGKVGSRPIIVKQRWAW